METVHYRLKNRLNFEYFLKFDSLNNSKNANKIIKDEIVFSGLSTRSRVNVIPISSFVVLQLPLLNRERHVLEPVPSVMFLV